MALVVVPKMEPILLVASACTGLMPGHQQQRGKLQQPAAAHHGVDPAGGEAGHHDQRRRFRPAFDLLDRNHSEAGLRGLQHVSP